MESPSFLVVTVTRNDSQFLSKLIPTVLNQTVRPSKWIIVDDSSSDDTKEMLSPLIEKHSWIEYLEDDDPEKSIIRGERIARLFSLGINRSNVDWDFCSKIDSDMELGETYIADIIAKFSLNPKLGIASGNCILLRGNKKLLEKVSEGHTRGGLKTYRRECFEQISGINAVDGWDTIDNLKAQMSGWETENFSDILAVQSRETGTRVGLVKTSFLEGRKCYYLGYFAPFLIARAANRMLYRYYLVCGLAMFFGFMFSMLSLSKTFEEREVSRFLKRKQISKLTFGLFAKS